MPRLPVRSDLLRSGGLPGSIDRILASPEYGEAFSSMCIEASRLALMHMESSLSGKAWRRKYTAGTKAILGRTAVQLDSLVDWFREIAVQCPGTRDRLVCRELLTKLGCSGTCDSAEEDDATTNLHTSAKQVVKVEETNGKNH